jgi:hypothetical protein
VSPPPQGDSTRANRPRYIARVSSLRSRTKAKAKAPKVKSWGIVLIRGHGKFLGFVEAPDRAAAELAAMRAFNLKDEQRKRVLVRERL